MATPDAARAYLTWSFVRELSFRGYWLVTSLYLVVVADLTPFQLVVMGTAMELTVLVAEIPTGVMADTVSRRWSIVISHLLMGAGMIGTGLTSSFPLLLATQMVWGVGWTFSSGADVAWITDELDDALRTERVLTTGARRRLYGAAAGMVVFGGLARLTSLATAIVMSGLVMVALGGHVVARFTEHRFAPVRERRWQESTAIFRRGLALARADRSLLLVLAATVMVNSGAEAFDRLHPKRLVDLGFPQPPIVWFTLLGIATLTVGAVVLRIVEARLAGNGGVHHLYVLACAAGAAGMLTLGHAPSDEVGVIGVVAVGGIAWTVIRTVSVIWVNRRAASDVRATVQSFLGQAESTGEIAGGLVMAVLAQATSISVALTASAAMLTTAGLFVARSRAAGGHDLPVGEAAPAKLGT